MPFQFRLQRVLELRDDHVRQCEAECERLNRILNELRAMLNKERDLYFSEREQLNQFVRNSEIHRIPLYDGSLEGRKKRMITLLENIKATQVEAELAEQTLIQARRELKVLENLKERKLTEYNVAADKKERKFLDEHASQKFARIEHFDKKGRES